MKNRKELKTIEIVSIVIILSVITIMVMPQIMNIIITSRLKVLNSSARIIIENAEHDYLVRKSLDDSYESISIPCTNIVKLNDDYGSCIINYNDEGIATIDLTGNSDGKFKNLQCFGNRDSLKCKDIIESN